MERVLGMGGVFFRAKAPKALATWYQTHLGIGLAPTDATMQPWVSKEGGTVFAPFSDDTDYFPPDRMFMLNFRVRDLYALPAQLRTGGVQITQEEAMDGIGRFARIHDPEGNPVELWEPILKGF